MTIIILNLVFVLLFLGGALYFWLGTNRSKTVSINSQDEDLEEDKSLLVSISVPKNNDRAPQAAEQMFAALHGILRADTEVQPHISFEIISKKKVIVFYIHMPRALKDFVLSQVYAQYPNVEVTIVSEEEDYAHPEEGLSVIGTELTLKKPTVYPIKTFVNFEVDPLSAITGVLSSVGDQEEIWTQLVVKPIEDEWQEAGEKEVKNIKEPPPKHVGFRQLIVKELKSFAIEFIRGVATGDPAGKAEEKKKDDKPKELGGPVQQAIKGIEEKITKLGYATTIRLVAKAPDDFAARAKLEQIIGAYKQFNTINLNSFIPKEIITGPTMAELYRSRDLGAEEMIFNITELASLFHFPSETVTTPTIAWAGSKKGEPPANLPVVGTVPADELTVFAQTNFRSEIRKFGIKKKDRRLHSYIIGKTGTGKSTLMENMIYDDIREGRGVAVVDPHGELIDHVLDFIPEERIQDVVYFSPADYDWPIGFNVLEHVNADMRNVVASGVVGIFKKIFGESWGPRLEYILRNAILALLEYPNSTLLGVMRILTDNAYRRQVISYVKDPVIRDFFVNEYEKYEPKFRQEAINPIQNKVGQFLSSSTIRNIVGQPRSTMDIRQIMDEGKILLADLSTGKIGEDNSALLGSMLITKIQLSAMGRTNMSEEDRRDFYLYVDEFQNFATDSFATILSEARKYRLNLVMINQYTSQMPESVANAVFGNVGTMVAFRVGAQDAEVLKQEFAPVFDVNDLVNLPNRNIYLKMAIDGVTVPAFSAATLPPPQDKSMLRDQVVSASRKQFTTPRSDVEDYITEWSAPINLSDELSDAQRQADRHGGKIVTKPQAFQEAASPTASTTFEPTVSVQQPNMTHSPAPEAEQQPTKSLTMPKGKIEILKDRFDRRWYSVTPAPAGDEVGESEEKIERGVVVAMPTSQDESGEATIEQPSAVTSELPESEVGESSQRGEVTLELPAHYLEVSDQPITTHEEQKNTVTKPESRGEGESEENNSHLITWDKADELGLKLENTHVDVPIEDNDFQPIDEIK